ncbi:hypothetical protein NLG97_g7874 [Lecanicillium saksenae]|uniref:Uncharacterized protein n=1 Tax=Lecanicillium saksenae TaxID=468837 RepID=A0ACC1QPE3_9HYPO|nr:hypothetical protein NLG97_g7874 [Lecanicillium saksenae]
MKFIVSSAILAALAPLALARDCTGGLTYCGATLLDIGNYRAQIVQALEAVGNPTSEDWVTRTLFYCTGFSGGAIEFRQACGPHCTNAGTNMNDYCG